MLIKNKDSSEFDADVMHIPDSVTQINFLFCDKQPSIIVIPDSVMYINKACFLCADKRKI